MDDYEITYMEIDGKYYVMAIWQDPEEIADKQGNPVCDKRSECIATFLDVNEAAAYCEGIFWTLHRRTLSHMKLRYSLLEPAER